MKKPESGKVQFGICDKCFRNLHDKGESISSAFLDVCIYHRHTQQSIPFSIMCDRYPIHIDYIIKQLEIENYITTHETDQGVYILPRVCHKHDKLPIYCSNRFLGCSSIVLEQNYND